jgi:cation transport regulator ChaB
MPQTYPARAAGIRAPRSRGDIEAARGSPRRDVAPSAAGAGRCRSPRASQATQLGTGVRPGPPLATSSRDGVQERLQRPFDHLATRFPPTPLALVDPLARCAMTPLVVAPPTGRDLVLQPAGSTLDARHEVLRGRAVEATLQGPSAPHALRAVALQDHVHATSSAEIAGPCHLLITIRAAPRTPASTTPGGRRGHWPGSGGYRSTMALTQKQRDRLPSTLERSPAKAQETYIHTLESAEEQHGDGEAAHRIALSALKHSFEKVGDHWEPKEHKGPSDRQAAKSGAAARRGRSNTAGGVDAGATKAHLMDRARQLDVAGRSKMTKDELVQAIDAANRKESARSRRR